MKSYTVSRGKARFYAGAAALGLAALATPAYAQSAGGADEEEAAAPAGSPIVVTGSRIARPTLSSPVPLTTVTAEELTQQGDISLGDALNDLPSLRTTFSQGNSTRFIGTAGLNLLDLRGLGTERTLVLVNGKRHITASPGQYLVDVNTIPVDLLERVDIVTGGNSAIYGSDAVAGVVNFILKRDFEGFAARGQAGISSRGDRASRFISGTYGKNFADGRGNIAIAAEYAKTDPLYFRDRDSLTGAFSGRCQFNLVENPAGEPFGTDGIFDNGPLCGVRNGAISDGGTLRGLGNGRFLRFGSDGNVFIDEPDQFIGTFTGNVIGGTGSTLRNTGQLAAGLTRVSVNLLTHFDVSDAFRPFIEAKYVHIDAIQEGQPSFWQGSIPNFFGGGSNLRCDNPFLTDQAFNVMSSQGICNATRDARAFAMSRFNIDFGGRGELHDRDTYRIVGGIEGTFNEDWNYELSFNYGRLETKLRSLNNLKLFDLNGNPDGFLLALDATRNAQGQIVCRVNAVTVTRPDCVPINVFGDGAPSAEALAFINTTGRREQKAEQFVALASVAGDLSQLFELPGGPIGFALGGEYREEKASSAFDELTASGGTFLNAIQPFTPPKLTVKEAFGEVNIPLLADMPLAKELSFGAAARVSDYNTATGTVWAYNVQGIYAPINDIRFRAAYATSVRAPTQSDLFSPLSQNFAFIADPCDAQNIGNNPNRQANCAAAGVPLATTPALSAICANSPFPVAPGAPFVNCNARAFSTGFESGGNPTLVEERGKSLTLGVVIEPSFIPGLNFTVDYYNIKVESLIATLAAQTIINNCYDNPNGINNPFCATVNRDPATGLFVEPAVIAGGVNFAAQKTEGIDFDVQYTKSFDNGHRLRFRGIATFLMTLDDFTNPADPELPNRRRSELGDPKWAASANFNYDFGPFDVTWAMRYLGPMTKSAYENQNRYIGRCPGSGVVGFSGGTCTPGELTILDPANNDQFEKPYFKAQTYHNVRVNWDIDDGKYNFYVGVDNVFDNKPPFGQLGTAGGDPYDTFGRYFYAGFQVRM